MNFFDNCKNLTVMVGGGSGVLFQPSGEKKYSYVLTAKHNLKDKLVIFKYDGTKLNIQKCYKHETLDIAIIKIEKTDSPEILIQKENPEYLNKYKIYGYPEIRQQKTEKEEKIFDYDLEITSTSNENYNIDLRNADSSPYEEVVGFSGGGLFNAENTKDARVYLAGIEYQLNNKGNGIEDETHNRIGFISIKAFDEIVDKYSNELVYLDDAKNFNKKYNVEETVIDLGDNKSIVLKTVPVEIDEVDSDGKNKKKILNVSIYPVAFEEYMYFCNERRNGKYPNDAGFGRGKHPVIYIDLNDAEEYCEWLNEKVNNEFIISLPSSTDWVNIANLDMPNFNENCIWYNNKDKTLEVDNNIIKAGNLNLYHMYGNVNEWCSDEMLMGGSFYNTSFTQMKKGKKAIRKHTNESIGFRILLKYKEL